MWKKRSNIHAETCTFLEIAFKLPRGNEVAGVCSGRTVSLFSWQDRNAHRKDRLKPSQKLYDVTCEIQQVRRHVNDLVKNTCPGHSAHAPVRSFTLRAEIALFTEALVWSDTDTSVTTRWLTFGNSAEVSLPARTAAALARGGVVAVPTEPGNIWGQCLGRLNCDSAFLRHQRSFWVYDLVEFSIVSLGHTLTAW